MDIEVELKDRMGSDLSVVNAARVSFDKESEWENIPHAGPIEGLLSYQDERLVAYLAKHNHWSPFGHASMQFRIKAPVFVARQLAKHQVGLTWNEVSRRYVDDPPQFYEPKEWRGRPVNSKFHKTSIGFTHGYPSDLTLINNSITQTMIDPKEKHVNLTARTKFGAEPSNDGANLTTAFKSSVKYQYTEDQSSVGTIGTEE